MLLSIQNIAHCESGHLCQGLLFIMLLSWSTYIVALFASRKLARHVTNSAMCSRPKMERTSNEQSGSGKMDAKFSAFFQRQCRH
jgi:hypothetical protein